MSDMDVAIEPTRMCSRRVLNLTSPGQSSDYNAHKKRAAPHGTALLISIQINPEPATYIS